MPRKIRVTCDAKECREELDGQGLAEVVGSRWVRRTIIDTLAPAQPGDSEFSGQQVLYFCPTHADALDAPALAHETVLELARRDVAREGSAAGDG